MTLYIQDFPDEIRWKLRQDAFRTGVTLRQLVIQILEEWVKGDRGGRPAEVEKAQEQKKLAVGEKIKGQMERLSRKVSDDVEF